MLHSKSNSWITRTYFSFYNQPKQFLLSSPSTLWPCLLYGLLLFLQQTFSYKYWAKGMKIKMKKLGLWCFYQHQHWNFPLFNPTGGNDYFPNFIIFLRNRIMMCCSEELPPFLPVGEYSICQAPLMYGMDHHWSLFWRTILISYVVLIFVILSYFFIFYKFSNMCLFFSGFLTT